MIARLEACVMRLGVDRSESLRLSRALIGGTFGVMCALALHELAAFVA